MHKNGEQAKFFLYILHNKHRKLHQKNHRNNNILQKSIIKNTWTYYKPDL